ncbi:cytochrome c [Frateuria defendens]|uniref:cytochrome c n=1 Tax=Frateuria defendens TaxID=2219559 RepID=UPI00066FF1DA|nr:cytochrome c [Frateuria defendens]
MRAALLIVLGLAIGIIGTVFAMNALRERDPLPKAVMNVMEHHIGELKQAVKRGQCEAAASHTRLQQMYMASLDVEPAFAGTEPDFLALAGKLRETLHGAAQAVPADCPALEATIKPVLQACHDCHQKYD